MKNIAELGLLTLKVLGILIFVVAIFGTLFGTLFILTTCAWDNRTGKDTGYISAVDKMHLTDDITIYVRRRPLDSSVSLTNAEKDETKYCTTQEYPEVIENAYKAMETGKRVVLTYDKPREFGWKKFGGCNQTPITKIEFAEE